MTKCSKKDLQNALFWDPFCPNTSQSIVFGKIRLSFLGCYNNVTSFHAVKYGQTTVISWELCL